MTVAAWDAVPAGQPPGHFLQRCLPWLLAVALHAALLTLWSSPQRSPARPGVAPAPSVMQLQLLPAPPEAMPLRALANGAAAAAPGRPAQPVQVVRRQASTLAAAPPGAPTASQATGRADPAAVPPAATLPDGSVAAGTAVTDGIPAPSLLDTPASRQALRAVATGRSLRELSDAAVGTARPLSSDERLGQDIARAARGDCLKGEFFGSGAGLLSLPFWLAAEAGGKCRR